MSISRKPSQLELIRPNSPSEWEAFHRIRKQVLFDARGTGNTYDPTHPDDIRPGNHPFLLTENGEFVAVVRIDIVGSQARLRRMAVTERRQRNGLGKSMIELILKFCREQGVREIRSNVAPDAVGFYLKCGFSKLEDQASPGSVQMRLEF